MKIVRRQFQKHTKCLLENTEKIKKVLKHINSFGKYKNPKNEILIQK